MARDDDEVGDALADAKRDLSLEPISQEANVCMFMLTNTDIAKHEEELYEKRI